jgi:hypothetical protein
MIKKLILQRKISKIIGVEKKSEHMSFLKNLVNLKPFAAYTSPIFPTFDQIKVHEEVALDPVH